MFVQVMEGKVADAAAWHRRAEIWEAELRPGAVGFLGSTRGVGADGSAFLLARFESEDAARANSSRPEQGQWWSETEGCYEGPVTFTESTDVDLFLDGGSDDAGFIQVMKGSADRERLRALDDLFAANVREIRPDVLGAVRVWTGPESYIQVGYFTSEADAREGEQREMPPEIARQFEGMGEMMADIDFLDLPEPVTT